VEPALAYLAAHGFWPIAAKKVQFTRHLTRELWRYELNVSTYERYPALAALLEGRWGLFVALAVPQRGADASHRLTTLKGSSLTARRSAGDLRSVIGAGDGMLNFVHTPDETLDVLRELGVLFAADERAELLRAFLNPDPPKAEVGGLISAFYGTAPRHSLSVPEIAERIAGSRAALFADLAARGRSSTNFAAFKAELRSAFQGASDWDAITCFVTDRSCEVPGLARSLAETEPTP